MARKLTKKQKGFAKDYLETGNGTLSALNHYDIEGKDKEKIASVIATENLGKPRVIAYLESKAERAAERVVELSEQEENLPVALGSSKDILDRAGFKAIEKSINVNVEIEGDDEIAQQFDAYLKNRLRQSGTQEHTRLDS